jgi:hypothetical protein
MNRAAAETAHRDVNFVVDRPVSAERNTGAQHRRAKAASKSELAAIQQQLG